MYFQQNRHSNRPGDYRAAAEATARDRGEAQGDAVRSEDLSGQRQLTALEQSEVIFSVYSLFLFFWNKHLHRKH